MNILGISAFYHDSAAALLQDGRIVAAAQEERFTRKKHDSSFPMNAVSYCLAEGGVAPGELDAVAFYDKPLLKFARILETYFSVAPGGMRSFMMAMPLWMREKLWIPYQIERSLLKSGIEIPKQIYFTEHHESHAASAFFPSPFERAAILTVDGVGEWATSSMGHGEGNTVRMIKELRFPHSLGLLYSAFTYFTGFKVNSGEYKLMGLAPYGEPKYVDRIRENLVELRDDGSFRLNMEYFGYLDGLTMTNHRFAELFDGAHRQPESEISQREMDLARSVQVVTEDVVLHMASHLQAETGGALGAALFSWHVIKDKERTVSAGTDSMQGSYLGPAFDDEEVGAYLDASGYPAERLGDEEWPQVLAELIDNEKVIGLCQGRMEFGPRALGNRSIVGDARSPRMQSVMNLKIKFRESFRPFAPSCLVERVSDFFELDRPSPYMLLVAPVEKTRCIKTGETEQVPLRERIHVARSDVPAITHVDYSARVQTVDPVTNPRYYKLIKAFEERTGYGIVINTSFNVRGEPIVCTPSDAYRCFMRTEMDCLVLGSYLLYKDKQPPWEEERDWRKDYVLD